MRTFILIFFFITNLPVCAQGVQTGQVVDGVSGEPLIGANIYLLSNLSVGTTSGVNGQFQLEVPSKHKQDSVLISFIGYQERVFPVSELAGKIMLQPKDQEMMEIEVVAAPLISEEFKMTSIEKLEIYTSPAAKADPLLAVNALPASTTTDESAAISLRGSSSIETGIFLNNVPVYDAVRYTQLNGIGTFSLFNTALVQNVTVFPGNPPLEFGNTTSGVISITTDENEVTDNNNSVIISPASVGYQRNQGLGRFSLKAFTNFQPSSLLKDLNKNALEQIKSFQSWDAGVYFYGPVSDKLTVKSYNYGLKETYVYDFIHPTFRGDFDQEKIRAFNVTNLLLRTKLGVLEWNQGYALSSAEYTYSATGFSVRNNSLFQGLNFYRRKEEYHVKAGLSFDHRASDVEGSFFEYDYAIGADYPTASYADDVAATTLEGYLYAKYFLSEQWILGGGVRKNLNDLEDRNYLSKQANLTYLPDKKWKVILGAGDYNKHGILENQGELVTINSKQLSLDLFYEQRDFNASLSLFNKINEWNGEESRDILGAEIYVEGSIGEHFSGNASYTFLDAESDDSYNQYDIGYFVRGNLSFEPGGFWTISLNGIYREGLQYFPVSEASFNSDLEVYQPFYGENPQRYDDYFILNLAVSKLFSISDDLGLVVFASVNNVTDHDNIRNFRYNFDYSEKTGEVYSRRLVYFGVQINF